MIASCHSLDTTSTDHLQTRFLTLLPKIENGARFHFRTVTCASRRSDDVAETVALCWRWFCRLAARGKDAARFVTTMVALAARHVRAGRRLCGQEHGKDVLSLTAQRRHGFKVEPLCTPPRRVQDPCEGAARGKTADDSVEERLYHNMQTPVPDQAAFRIDWPRFVKTLSGRDRRLAGYLSLGHSALAAANKFGLSPGRVTQLRQQWCHAWRSQDDEAAPVRECRRENRVLAVA